MTHRLLLAAAVLTGAAALAAGCGDSSSSGGGSGDETTSAADWADGLCTAVTTWKDSLTSVVSSLPSGVTEDSLGDLAGEATDANETLVDDLQGLGTPETEAGSEAKETVDGLASDLREDTDTIKGAIDDASGSGGVAAAISTVVGTFAQMQSEVKTAVDTLEGLDVEGELRTAFDDAESCASLRGS